jgi:hypothetical protein
MTTLLDSRGRKGKEPSEKKVDGGATVTSK